MSISIRAGLLRTASVLALFASAVTPLAVARAQPDSEGAPAKPSEVIDEVIVTATRRNQSALKVPYNITATTQAQLQAAGVSDFSKLAQVVPGLVYNGGGIRQGGSTNGFILRGLNTDRTSTSDLPSLTVAPVSVYIDDTPIFANLHISDVERVEVLRGPQGTLYGSGSVGGTIRFIYNEPDPTKFTASLTGDLSSTDKAGGPNYTVDGIVNLPLSRKLALRVSAGHIFQNGFIDAKNLYELQGNGAPALATPGDPIASLPLTRSQKDIDDSDLTYVHAALKYEEGPWKAILTYHHQEETADGQSADTRGIGALPTSFSSLVTPGFFNDGFDAAIPPNYGEDQTGIFIREPYSRHLDLGSLEVARDFGFATLTSSTSYYENSSRAFQDLSGSYQTNLGTLYFGYPRLAVPSLRESGDRTFTEEVRLVSNDEGPVRWVAGAFYQDQRLRFNTTDTVLGFGDFATALFGFPLTEERAFDYKRRMSFQDIALFGELTYHVTDRWQVTGGLRAIYQNLAVSTITKLPICGAFCSTTGDPEGTTTGENGNQQRRLLGKFNTSVDLAKDLMAYFTFSEGFRRGGANAVPITGFFAHPEEFLSFAPDTVRSYELGLKGRLGQNVQLTVAAYQVDWDKPQLNILTPFGGFYAAVNGKSATTRGVELDLSYQVTQSLSLTGGYSYTDATLDSAFSIGSSSFGAKGERLPGVPEHQFTAGGDYAAPLGPDLSLLAHVDGAYRSGISTALTGSLGNTTVPGFWIWNASLGVQSDHWRTSLYADNLFNARGVTTAIPASDVGPRHGVSWVSRPLTIGLRISYSYGE